MAEKIYTVGDLDAVVVEWLRLRYAIPCMSRHVFYRLRRALIAVFGMPLKRVRPDSALTPRNWSSPTCSGDRGGKQ